MKKLLFTMLASVVCLSLILSSCDKSSDDSQATLQVHLTDNPILGLTEVNVDIQKVSVRLGDDSLNTEAWVDLATNAQTYNLLNLQNGVSVLLASGNLQPVMVKEIRFVLGSNNTVKDTLGLTYPLIVPSGSESGLKLKVDKKLGVGLQTLLIDFDAALSIKIERDGYKLRPVLKIK